MAEQIKTNETKVEAPMTEVQVLAKHAAKMAKVARKISRGQDLLREVYNDCEKEYEGLKKAKQPCKLLKDFMNFDGTLADLEGVDGECKGWANFFAEAEKQLEEDEEEDN